MKLKFHFKFPQKCGGLTQHLDFGGKLQQFLDKILQMFVQLCEWRAQQFSQARFQIELIYQNIQNSGKATFKNSRDATREFVRINLFHPDSYFLLVGMALLVFVTRSFTAPGIDYGPWRPVVVTLAALFAGAIPLVMSLLLFPLHILFRVNTWVLMSLNIALSANIFALFEPEIPNYFYEEGVLAYSDLIFGILVFYALALGYLQLRLNNYICLSCYIKRHSVRDINSIVPVEKRGEVLALSAQDHYVDIVTDHGQHMNRMSMKEAVSMMPEDVGLQVHRSHWVSFNAMLSLEKIGDRNFITIRNNAQIPVAKSKVADVRAHLASR